MIQSGNGTWKGSKVNWDKVAAPLPVKSAAPAAGTVVIAVAQTTWTNWNLQEPLADLVGNTCCCCKTNPQ